MVSIFKKVAFEITKIVGKHETSFYRYTIFERKFNVNSEISGLCMQIFKPISIRNQSFPSINHFFKLQTTCAAALLLRKISVWRSTLVCTQLNVTLYLTHSLSPSLVIPQLL